LLALADAVREAGRPAMSQAPVPEEPAYPHLRLLKSDEDR
jgi:hypothetical protein